MAHQVLHRDRPVGRPDVVGRLAIVIYRDVHAGEFWKILAEGIVDQELALLIQHQRADRRHRLGHRGDVEDGVGGHGDIGRLVAAAIGVEHHELAAPGHRDDRAGNPAGLDVGFQRCLDPRQPLAGHADLFGFGAGQGIVGARA